jgi:hypothetical protein
MLLPPMFSPPWYLDPLKMSTVTLFPCDSLTYCYVLAHSQRPMSFRPLWACLNELSHVT